MSDERQLPLQDPKTLYSILGDIPPKPPVVDPAKHWTYWRDGFEENTSCASCYDREEAISEGLNEAEGEDQFYIAPCWEEMPTLGPINAEWLLEHYTDINNLELPDDYTDDIFQHGPGIWGMKPELKAELEAELQPHWAEIEKKLLAFLAKHCYPLHQTGEEELIVCADYTEEGILKVVKEGEDD